MLKKDAKNSNTPELAKAGKAIQLWNNIIRKKRDKKYQLGI